MKTIKRVAGSRGKCIFTFLHFKANLFPKLLANGKLEDK